MEEVNLNFFQGAIVAITRRTAGIAFLHHLDLKSPKSLALTGLCEMARPHHVPLPGGCVLPAARLLAQTTVSLGHCFPSGFRRWLSAESTAFKETPGSQAALKEIFTSHGGQSRKALEGISRLQSHLGQVP